MSDSKTGKEKTKGALKTIAAVGTAVATIAGAVVSLIKTDKD